MSNFRGGKGVNVKAGKIHAPARGVLMEEQKIVERPKMTVERHVDGQN
jgi:hypothetical protein